MPKKGTKKVKAHKRTDYRDPLSRISKVLTGRSNKTQAVSEHYRKKRKK